MATALITGANRGLGLELARQYVNDGWQVIACARNRSAELDRLAADHQEVGLATLDVADHAGIETLAGRLAGTRVDVLVNNAGYYGKALFGQGGFEDQAFGNTDYADWERTFRINTMAPLKMAEAFIEHVATSEQKKIVTLTSMLGSMELNDIGGIYRYRSSKAAVNSIMRSLAIDLLPRGIIAAAIHPGWVQTAMGGPDAELDIAISVSGIRRVVAELTADDAGRVFAFDGERLPW